MKTKRTQFLAVTAAVILPCAIMQVAAQTGATPGTAAAADQIGYAVSNGIVYAIQGGRAVPVTTVQSMRETPRGLGGIDPRVLNLQPGQMLTRDGRLVVVPKNVTIPAAPRRFSGATAPPNGGVPGRGTTTQRNGNPTTPTRR